MDKRKAALSALLVVCLLASVAWAEPPQADVNDWFHAMTELVGNTGNRESFTPNEGRALDYLTKVWEGQGFSQKDGTLFVQRVSASRELADQTGWNGGVANLIAIQKASHDDSNIIIVCAHYDTFYNTVGVLDNASGVAALLTLSRAFAAMKPYPYTELRFTAFAGEEFGNVGSAGYVSRMTTEEAARVLAVYNIDILAVEEGAIDVALCCNTLGGRGANGAYRVGNDDEPVENRASLAFSQAFWELGGFTEKQRNIDFCIPQHWGGGDHTAFHDAYMDAATVCFQGNYTVGGLWPDDMHTPDDDLNKQFDLPRTQHALNVLSRAIDSLATDHEYGGAIEDEE